MRGLDTNVVVRYLTQDDPAQAEKVNGLIEKAVAGGEKLHLDGIVLCEIVWVLNSAYGFDKSTIVQAVEKILDTAHFVIADRELFREALTAYREGSGDFSDYAIGLRNRHAGCADTVTFDRGLRKSMLFSLL
ncbi:MAG: PIN domain-containing protein [Mycobacteriales bacterium]